MNDDPNLKTTDPKFFQKSIHQLNMLDLYLRPVFNYVLEYRFKSHMVQSDISEHCVPNLLAEMDNMANDGIDVSRSAQELRRVINQVDKALYEEPLLQYLNKYK